MAGALTATRGRLVRHEDTGHTLSSVAHLVIVHLGGRVMQQGAKAARGPQGLAAGKAQAGGAAPPRTRLAHRQGRAGVAAYAWPRPASSCPPSGSRQDPAGQSSLAATAPL